jgi:hypothetical protein
MSRIKITDRTAYEMAAEVCEGLMALEASKHAPLPDDLKYIFVKKIITPLRYIALLMDANLGLETAVDLVLMVKVPHLIPAWNDVRKTLLNEERRRRIYDDDEVVDSFEQAASVIESIKGRM